MWRITICEDQKQHTSAPPWFNAQRSNLLQANYQLRNYFTCFQWKMLSEFHIHLCLESAASPPTFHMLYFLFWLQGST